MLTKTAFIKDLKKLIAFRTITSDQAEIKKALDFVVSKINKKAFIKIYKNKNTYILIASNKKTLTPDVGYLAHIDVVSAKPDQFKMRVKKNIAFGRGVIDMKFSLPIGYSLLNEMIENKRKESFSLVITSDEEMGGYLGADYLADKLKFRPGVLIVPDGGENFIFTNKSKGVCQLEIIAKGKPAHASTPWEGKSAIENLIILSSKLLKEFGPNNKKPNWKTTMNIGQFNAGLSINQVCSEANMKVDFRYPESVTPKEIKTKVEKIAKKIDKNITVSFFSVGDPTFTDFKLPIVKKFISSMEKSLGRRINIEGAYGASDARHFAPYKIPVLMIGPYGGELHSDNENVNIDSCLKLYFGFRNFLNLQ